MTYLRAHQTNPPRYLPVLGIGRGGMGRIDLALALGIPGAEQLVVLKRLREPEQQTAEERAALVWEAQLSARLAHPNIIQTLALEVLDGELVVVLEYLEGGSLAALARSCAALGEPVPRPVLLRIVRDALAGLEHAHELTDYDGSALGIVHRDVSPSNLLLTADGATKLIDFGIAKAARSLADTPPGFIKGKLGYMAPEQILGTAIDRRADLYAVGVMLWEGLTQRRFSASDSIRVCLETRLREQPVSVRTLAAGVPRDLDLIVARCLARDAELRWTSARELGAALDRYVEAHAEHASAPDVAELVVRHCGPTLKARRMAVRATMARIAPSVPGLAQHERLDVRYRSELGDPSHAATVTRAALPRRRSGRVLPFGAAILGAIGSCAFGSLPSARARPGPALSSEAAREATFLSAARALSPARRKATEPGGTPPPSPRPRRPGAPSSATAPSATDRTKRPDGDAPEHGPAAGAVTIDTYPWSRVTIDGTFRGVTPLVLVPLTAGSHVVEVESVDQGRLVRTVEVREGETPAEQWRFE